MDWPIVKTRTGLPDAIRQEARTAAQWRQLDRVPLDAALGRDLYPNGHHQGMRRYYHITETRPATEKERAAMLAQERIARNESLRKRRERQEREHEAAMQTVYADLAAAEQALAVARTGYRELCRSLASWIRMPSGDKTPLVIDTETTGLDPEVDELLQLSILDAETGAVLYSGRFRPMSTMTWAEAQAINGISPDMAKECCFLGDQMLTIQSILMRATEIIGYSTDFDVSFLVEAGFHLDHVERITDVLPMYTAYCGDNQRHSLVDCAADLGYKWGQDRAHDALADCKATLYCYGRLKQEGL